MKTAVVITAVIAAFATVAVRQKLTQKPSAKFQLAVSSGVSITLPQITGNFNNPNYNSCVERYSGIHFLSGAYDQNGAGEFQKLFMGCPSAQIRYQLLSNGNSLITFNSPWRPPMASVPFAAIYQGTGKSLTLQYAVEGTGWPGSIVVQ